MEMEINGTEDKNQEQSINYVIINKIYHIKLLYHETILCEIIKMIRYIFSKLFYDLKRKTHTIG